MSEVPERIYLQWYGDAEPVEGAIYEVPHDGVTWCVDEIFNSDVEYVRADLYRKMQQALRYLYDEWHNGMTTEFAEALDQAERVLDEAEVSE
jgi:hypothetical protein